MKRKTPGNRITRLHSLVNDLSDRDDQLKKDMRLFEEFYQKEEMALLHTKQIV